MELILDLMLKSETSSMIYKHFRIYVIFPLSSRGAVPVRTADEKAKATVLSNIQIHIFLFVIQE